MRLLVLLVLLLTALPAQAQLFAYDQDRPPAVQAVMVSATDVSFSYRGGDDAPRARYDVEGLALGLAYTRPGMRGALAYRDADDQKLLDLSIAVWQGILPLPSPSPRLQLFVPLMLHSQYRRATRIEPDAEAAPQLAVDAFEIASLGLGTGVTAFGAVGRRVTFRLRATPVIAFAQRDLGQTAGSMRLFEGEALLHVGPLVARRVGLSVGYAFRSQRWNLSADDLLDEVVTDDLFDYGGTSHSLSVGLHF